MMTLTASLLLGTVTVVLPPEANVSGTELRLDAIAKVEGENPAEVAAISSLHLGYAPAPGYSRLLDAQRLALDIERAAPNVDVVFQGARACRVWPETTSISGAAIEAVAREELADGVAATLGLEDRPALDRVDALDRAVAGRDQRRFVPGERSGTGPQAADEEGTQTAVGAVGELGFAGVGAREATIRSEDGSP